MRTLIVSLMFCAVLLSACSSNKRVVASQVTVSDSVASRSVSSTWFSLDSVLSMNSFEFDSLELVAVDVPASDSIGPDMKPVWLDTARFSKLHIKGGKSMSKYSCVAADGAGRQEKDSVADMKGSELDCDSVAEVCSVYDPPDLVPLALAILICGVIAAVIFFRLKK